MAGTKRQIDEIKDLIDRFFSDTSRSQKETRDGLEEILEHVTQYIDALPESD